MFSEITYFDGVQDKVEDMLEKTDLWGGPETYPHMAAGWAVAFDTPYPWTKQVASDHGGPNHRLGRPDGGGERNIGTACESASMLRRTPKNKLSTSRLDSRGGGIEQLAFEFAISSTGILAKVSYLPPVSKKADHRLTHLACV